MSLPFRHVFFVTDLEGAAGVTDWSQTREGGPAQEAARALLTAEINAVVAGLLGRAAAAGEALQVSVWDGHGTGGTRFDALDPRVVKYRHDDPRGFGGVLEAVRAAEVPADALGFIGQHAMEGTGGNLAHTYSSTRVKLHRLNGVPIGEFGTRALHAWALGMPTVFFSGDDVACREATALVPGLVEVAVKRSTGVTTAECLPHEESCRVLAEAAPRILDLAPDDAALVPRDLPAPPYCYEQLRHRKWGIVPRPTRIARGDDLAQVLRNV
ncbi:MAG: peptidase M55 [Myxococcales bacterium]|nr:peptidase M55 [Myxococcales bacterium]